MWHRKVRPERTTLQAWLSTPTRDSSSLLPHAFLSPQSSRRDRRRSNLSWGRRSSAASVSTSMPRNVRQVVGPSRLCCARGVPSWEQTSSSAANASAYSDERGGLMTIKSSK